MGEGLSKDDREQLDRVVSRLGAIVSRLDGILQQVAIGAGEIRNLDASISMKIDAIMKGRKP
jgi:hypothetical protein